MKIKDIFENLEDKKKLIIPDDVMNKLKTHIRDGAKDLNIEWANALELVNKAFKIEAVKIPRPAERHAWEQYNELLEYAVKQLKKYREEPDIDDSWRMSSKIFKY